MTDYKMTCVKEIISRLLDRNWHEIYEFHKTYKMPASSTLEAIDVLLQEKLIIKSGNKIKLIDSPSNKEISLLNLYLKTKKPKILKKNDYWC